MATSENFCTDNFSLLVGPKGDKGVAGAVGPAGPAGKQGPTGGVGNAGSSKVDVTFSNDTTPYVEVSSLGNYVTIGYVLFPGSTAFGTASYINVVASMINAGGISSSFNIKVEDVTGGISNLIASMTSSTGAATEVLEILTDTSLNNLPTTAAVFKISANLASKASALQVKPTLRLYAFELR
jgi:hypothetical protein